jgi:energy-converting hydrogenase Eha subunit G
MKLIVHMLDLTNTSIVYVAEGTHVSIRHAYELVRPMSLQVLYTVDTTHLLLGLLLFGLVSAAGFPGFGLVCVSLLQFGTHSPRLETVEFRTAQPTVVMLAIWGAVKGVYDLYKDVRQASAGKLPSQEQVILDAGTGTP